MSMMNQQLARALRHQRQSSLLVLAATRQEAQPRPYESTRVTDQSRYENMPAPTDDDMISKLPYTLT